MTSASNELVTNLLLVKTLTSNLLANLIQQSKSSSISSSTTIALSDVRNDYNIISTAIGKEVTSLSLALKPVASIPIAQGVLQNLRNQLERLGLLFIQAPSRGALAREMKSVPSSSHQMLKVRQTNAIERIYSWSGQELLESVERFLKGTIDVVKSPANKALRNLLLQVTALVWEKVASIKEISANELEATRKEWESVLELLEDCLEELKELQEHNEDPTELDEDEEEEEDEEIDDFRSTVKLSDLETRRVVAAHDLMDIGRRIIHRLWTCTSPSDTFDPTTSPYSNSTYLDKALELSQQFSAKADDLASALSPPQLTTKLHQYATLFTSLAVSFSQQIVVAIGDSDEVERKWQLTVQKRLEQAQLRLENVK